MIDRPGSPRILRSSVLQTSHSQLETPSHRSQAKVPKLKFLSQISPNSANCRGSDGVDRRAHGSTGNLLTLPASRFHYCLQYKLNITFKNLIFFYMLIELLQISFTFTIQNTVWGFALMSYYLFF